MKAKMIASPRLYFDSYYYTVKCLQIELMALSGAREPHWASQLAACITLRNRTVFWKGVSGKEWGMKADNCTEFYWGKNNGQEGD